MWPMGLMFMKTFPVKQYSYQNGLAAYLMLCIKVSLFVTVMILSFRTDRPGQTVQTQIRLLLEEQSDQGLHCLLFCLHRLDSLFCGGAN